MPGLPPRDAQDAGREVLLERRLAHEVAPPALEERLAARVDVERARLRRRGRHARARRDRAARPRAAGPSAPRKWSAMASFTRSVTKSRLFTGLRCALVSTLKVRSAEKYSRQLHFLAARVDVVLVRVRELRDAPEDAARDARMQVRRVDQIEGTRERNPGFGRLRVLRAQVRQLARRARVPAPAGTGRRNNSCGLFCRLCTQNGFTTTSTTIAKRITVGISFTQR